MAVLRFLLFVLLEIAFAPLQIVGTTIFGARLRFLNRPRGISGTAYEPFMARLSLNDVGTRSDPASAQIAPHLPALSPSVVLLLFRTLALAARWSGFRGSFFAYPGPKPSKMMTFISHRTHFFDEAIAAAVAEDSPIRQLVLLGAGFDTRCYSPLPDGTDLRQVAADRGVCLFEADQPPTQEAKRQALRDGGVDARHVTFAPTDFQQRSWLQSLQENGFDPQLPTFVLWEGVTMYLDDDSVQKTLLEIAAFAPGSSVALDYMSRELVFAEKPFRAFGLYVRYALRGVYGESWNFGISTRRPLEPLVEEFAAAQGLQALRVEALGVGRHSKASMGGLLLAEVPQR